MTSTPADTQRVVADYAARLEQDLAENAHPAPVSTLPHSKESIRLAIEESVAALSEMGQMTPDLKDFLQTAYVSLADYLPDDLVKLMREYHEAAETLRNETAVTRDRMRTAAWQRLSETSSLVAGIARSIAEEEARLRSDFDVLVSRAAQPPAHAESESEDVRIP